jgi:hypothetical protein
MPPPGPIGRTHQQEPVMSSPASEKSTRAAASSGSAGTSGPSAAQVVRGNGASGAEAATGHGRTRIAEAVVSKIAGLCRA